MKNKKEKQKRDSSYSAGQRALAMAGAAVLAGLYLLTLVLAFSGSSRTMSALMAALFASIVLPALIYVYQMIWRGLHRDRDEEDPG